MSLKTILDPSDFPALFLFFNGRAFPRVEALNDLERAFFAIAFQREPMPRQSVILKAIQRTIVNVSNSERGI